MDITGLINDNEGALVGAIGGLMIAIIASFLTHFFSNYRQRAKEKTLYIGLLQTMLIEITYQKHQLEKIGESVKSFMELSIERKKFVADSIPIPLNLSISDSILSKIIDYKRYERSVFVNLAIYLNQLRDVNTYLNFKIARDINSTLNDAIVSENSIQVYFSVLQNDHINRAKTGNVKLKLLIEKELHKFPKEQVSIIENIKE